MRRTILLPLLFVSVSSFAAITGVVTPPTARVRAFAPETFQVMTARLLAGAPDPQPLATATPNATGAFSIDVKGAPVVDLFFEADGHESLRVTAAEGEDIGDVFLQPQRRERVRLLSDGKPLAGAIVWSDLLPPTRTDSRGTMARMRGGAYVIHPDVGFATALFPADGSDADVQSLPGVRGRVTHADGSPAAGVTIYAAGVPIAHSGDDGRFAISHLPASAKSIVTIDGNEIAVAPRTASELNLVLKPGASISGSVTAGGRPVAGAIVKLQRADSDRWDAITDAKGQYAIAPLPPGTWSGSVEHPLYSSASAAQIVVSGATTHSFAVSPQAVIRGTVMTEEGKPAAGALVSYAGARPRIVTAGAHGEFALRLPFDSPFFVVSGKSGYAMAVAGPFRVAAGQTKSGVTMTLKHGFPMRVQVIDKARTPVSGAAIDLSPSADRDAGAFISLPCSIADRETCRYTAADGTWDLRLVEQTYDVHVGGDVAPVLLRAKELNPRTSPLIVTVDRGGDVTGRVVFGDGIPVAGARIVTRGAPAPGTTTDAGGGFTLKHLPRMPMSLVVTTADDPPIDSAPFDVTPPAREVTITIPVPARIEGRVIDRATSAPIPSFHVAPMRPGIGSRGMDVSSDDGTFVLPRVLPGRMELRVSARGYVTGSVADINVEPGKTLSGVEVKLDRGARLTGRVTSGDKPVAQATVHFGTANIRFVGVPATTDENGEYTLEGVPAGSQTIEFMKDGFVTKRKNVDVEGGKEVRLDVELDRGREIHGRTVDRQGSAVAGARVSVTSPSAHFVNGAVTDSDGQFTIAGLEDGRYRVTGQKNGFVNASAEDVDPASGNAIVLTLDRGGTITGRVTGVPEAELPTLRVTASSPTTNATQTVNPDGTFTLNGIADGRVILVANAPFPRNRQSRPKTVDVVNGTADPVVIDFSEGIAIRGRVTREGVPVTTGTVSFVVIGGVYASRSGLISGDGTYEVNGLDAADYDIVLRIDSGTSDQGRYTVSGNATHDIDLRGGSIQGVVLDASTGAPLPNANLSIVPPKDTRLFRSALSDSDGRFVLDLLPDGPIEIRAQLEHYASAVTTVTVSGGSAPPVELRLEKGSEAAVRIVDGQSGATIDGFVALFDANNHTVANAMNRAEDGAMHLWASPGQYRAMVNANGYLPQQASVTVPGPEVRVALMRSARLLIRSRSGGLFRVVTATVPAPGIGGTVNSGFVIAPGSQLFTELQAGPCEVDLLSKDRQTVLQKYNVVLTAGQTTTLDAD